jgi:hypothetical protein
MTDEKRPSNATRAGGGDESEPDAQATLRKLA